MFVMPSGRHKGRPNLAMFVSPSRLHRTHATLACNIVFITNLALSDRCTQLSFTNQCGPASRATGLPRDFTKTRVEARLRCRRVDGALRSEIYALTGIPVM